MNARPKQAVSSGFLGFFEGRSGSILVYFVLLPLLVLLVLVVPPISLPSRIFSAGYVSVPKTGALIKDADGTELAIPDGVVANGSSIKLSSTSRQSFMASTLSQSLPSYIEVKSPLYSFSVQGEAPNESTLSVPIPKESEPYNTLDLYAQFNQKWFKIPFILNQTDQRLEADLNFIPDYVVVAQTKPQAPLIGASIASQDPLPAPAAQVLVEVNPAGLRISDQGALAGDAILVPESSPSSTFSILPTIANSDEQGTRLDLTENMLSDSSQRTTHINMLVDLAVQKLYAGFNLAYYGLVASDEPVFTAFVRELARALHAKQKTLSVSLPLPRPVAEQEWDTAGYNWALIGRYADEVKIPMLPDPHAYEGDNPLMEQYLQWAVGQVDRYKLQIVHSSMGRDEVGNDYSPVGYADSLKLLGPMTLPDQISPLQDVTLEIPKLRDGGGIQFHAASGLYFFKYKDAGNASHTVWLENASSLAKQVDLILKYNLSGVALEDLNQKGGPDPSIWTVLSQYRSLQPTTLQTNIAIVWLVDGKPVGKSPANDPKFVWRAPSTPGSHSLDVALSTDGGQSTGPLLGDQALEISQATPTPEPTERPTAQPTEVPPTPTKVIVIAKPTKVPVAPPAPPPINLGGFGYGAQLNWTNTSLGNDGEMSTLNSMGFGWAKVQVRWCDIEGSQGNANLSSLDNIISVANAHQIKLLFSVVCGPSWTGAVKGCSWCNPGPPSNPADLGNFLNGISGRYCGKGLGAIEVWNEENLRTEWGQNQINPSDYIRYLSVARQRIKEACPGMIVVSGAPTPTGGDGGATAMDDIQYLSGLYGAGLKNYTDAVGAHPSGFNCPVDADWRTVTNPTAKFRGPFDNHHHSWCFRGTMDGYRNVMVASGDAGKQIWPTEFGWGVSSNPAPGYEYESDNTQQQQSDWLVGAYRYGKSAGWVGVMFLWNLDFNNSNADNRAFAVLGTPAQAALAGMPK